jgi:hypothetical protein
MDHYCYTMLTIYSFIHYIIPLERGLCLVFEIILHRKLVVKIV